MLTRTCLCLITRPAAGGREVLLGRNVYIADHIHGIARPEMPAFEQPLVASIIWAGASPFTKIMALQPERFGIEVMPSQETWKLIGEKYVAGIIYFCQGCKII